MVKLGRNEADVPSTSLVFSLYLRRASDSPDFKSGRIGDFEVLDKGLRSYELPLSDSALATLFSNEGAYSTEDYLLRAYISTVPLVSAFEDLICWESSLNDCCALKG